MVYLDRRLNNINLNDYPSMTYSQVPLGVAGFERINDAPVTIASDATVPIGKGGAANEDDFFLSGAVCAKIQRGVKKSKTQKVDVVVGSEAYVSLRNVDMRNRKDLPDGTALAGPPAVPGAQDNNIPIGAPNNFTLDNTGVYGAPGTATDFVRYDPMRTDTRITEQMNPYSLATNGEVNTAVEKHGLILMYTANELDTNRDVHSR